MSDKKTEEEQKAEAVRKSRLLLALCREIGERMEERAKGKPQDARSSKGGR